MEQQFYEWNHRWLLFLMVIGQITSVVSDREHAAHGFGSKFRNEHSQNDGEHNTHEDHTMFLGSKKVAESFDELSPEEAKRRLAILARKMDSNNDGYVSRKELAEVIAHNLIALDVDEAKERFREMDADSDNFVTWEEYIKEAFGDIDPSNEDMDADDKRLLEDDKKYFAKADQDNDGKLSESEFSAFQNPEIYDHMHATLVEITLGEKDKDNDGRISLEEFLGELVEDPKSEWHVVESRRFHDNDADKNGYLEGAELEKWLIQSVNSSAIEETDHLMNTADKNHDGRLSIEEIIDESDLFVGSEATHHGDNLLDLPHDEL